MTGPIRKYAALILIAILSANPAAANPSEQKPAKLKAVVLPTMGYAPFFIAENEGYFTEQGLDIEYVRLGGESLKTVPALIQGDIDVVAGTISIGIINSAVREGRVKIVADRGYIGDRECPYASILARRTIIETKKKNDPNQLRGLKIVVNSTSIDGYCADKALARFGLALDDLAVQYIPHSVRLEAIKTGALDLVKASEPWVTRILDTGNAVVWISDYEVIPDFQYGVVLYGQNLLDKNPEAGKCFMVAYLKAVRQYNKGKTDRNLEILAEHTELDRELLKKICWPTFRNDGSINIDSILEFQKWGLKKGLIDQPASKEQLWDSRFIDYANRILGE